MLQTQAGRVFAPEVHALRLKFVQAFEATSHLQDHQLILTPRETAIFHDHPEVFEQVVRDLGGSMRSRDHRGFPRLRSSQHFCDDEHELHAVWTRSVWRPWHQVNGLACTNCDLFIEEPS